MPFLNYHHLRYFREIAHAQSLTKAAAKLNLSAPALSIQLRQLEESLGHTLLDRSRTGLTLTEAGRLTLDYAETIFRAGEEMVDVLQHRPEVGRQVLRVGAVATLSRNFQMEFLKPVLHRPMLELVLRSSSLRELLVGLHAHEVDIVLSNQPARRDAHTARHSHLLSELPVSLVGTKVWKKKRLRFPQDFNDVPVILPTLENDTRATFDRLVASAGVRPLVIAEVDDMAMLRLLAREGDGLALVPPVVARDEIKDGTLVVTHRLKEIRERFYAITPSRKFPNLIVAELIKAAGGK